MIMLAGEKWTNDVYSFYVSKNSILFIKKSERLLIFINQICWSAIRVLTIYKNNNNFYQIYFI